MCTQASSEHARILDSRVTGRDRVHTTAATPAPLGTPDFAVVRL
ncbi:hypothetical protein GFS60_05939 [Rhodococcus sp. WAY2]|nr:hypothetical protein GFS60_05939 [Rhodococcus sp. WAY2]